VLIPNKLAKAEAQRRRWVGRNLRVITLFESALAGRLFRDPQVTISRRGEVEGHGSGREAAGFSQVRGGGAALNTSHLLDTGVRNQGMADAGKVQAGRTPASHVGVWPGCQASFRKGAQ